MKFEIESKMTVDQAMDAIVSETNLTTGTLDYGSLYKYFNGYVAGNKFEIKRRIIYRNSFRPLIRGEVLENPETGGSTIKINMGLSPFTVFGIAIFVVMILVLSLVMGITGATKSGSWVSAGLETFLMALFLFGVMFLFSAIPFFIEAGISRRKIYEVFGDEKKF